MANRTLKLVVNLTFSDHADFDDNGLQEIVENVAESIKHTADTKGITPDGYETYVAQIQVTEPFSKAETEINI